MEGIVRLAGETGAAYRVLCDYATMPRPRSISRLAVAQVKEGGPSLRSLQRWSIKYEWTQRVAIFDVAQAEARVERWQERKTEVKESDWQDSMAFRQRVMGMLAAAADAAELVKLAQVLKIASELQRLACDEPTSKVELSGAALDELLEREFRRLANMGPGQQARLSRAPDSDADAD